MKRIKHKQWLNRHSKIKHKNKLKRKFKRIRHKTIGDPFSQSSKARKKAQHNIEKNKFKTLIPPQNFSIYSNSEQTLSFFSEVLTMFKKGKPIYFEMRHIQYMTIDAIMYLLAILKNLKHLNIIHSIKGSVPSDVKCRSLLQSSGFFEYVKSNNRRTDLSRSSEIVQIANGSNVDPLVTRKICDFSMLKLGVNRLYIKNLFGMIIELMTNTRQHAYKNSVRHFKITEWYIFVQYIKEKDVIRFIFLDTGEGIPSTVRKEMLEVVGIGSHTKCIISALNGELRSRTGETFRGKGLPKINSFYLKHYIKDLTIISNYGYVSKDDEGDLTQELIGTIFYWELTRSA